MADFSRMESHQLMQLVSEYAAHRESMSKLALTDPAHTAAVEKSLEMVHTIGQGLEALTFRREEMREWLQLALTCRSLQQEAALVADPAVFRIAQETLLRLLNQLVPVSLAAEVGVDARVVLRVVAVVRGGIEDRVEVDLRDAQAG